MWAVASAVGPVMGGALTQAASWRWIYWINLPICGTTFLLLLLFLDVHNPRTAFMDGIRAIDWSGSLAILGLTLMLLLGLNFGGGTFSWSSPQVICLIVFGCLMSLVFIYCEGHLAKYPLMPLRVFRLTSNIASFVVTFCHGMVRETRDFFSFLIVSPTDRGLPRSFSAGTITSHSTSNRPRARRR
jgi:MFS family permease